MKLLILNRFEMKLISNLLILIIYFFGFNKVNGESYEPLTILGNTGIWGMSSTQFNLPSGITISSIDGKIFIADYGNNRISVWTQSGNNFGNLTTFGSFGSGTNQFKSPHEIAIGSDGKIFIADFQNHRISVWTQSGNNFISIASFGSMGFNLNEFTGPTSVSLSQDGKIFIADSYNHRISVWTQSGNNFGNLTTFGGFGTATNQLNFAIRVSIAFDGKIYVADQFNKRISVWTQSGNNFGNLTTFGSNGISQNQFSSLYDMEIDSDNNIYVADTYNNRISIWTQSGNNFGNLTTFGSFGNDLNQFNEPDGIGLLPDGKIFISDLRNHRISIWQKCNNGFKPQITTQPLSQTTCGNNLANFSVSATGSNLSYKWSNGENTPSISTSQVGNYVVTVSGSCGNVVSNTATLSNFQQPNLTIAPSNVVICNGFSATITATGASSYLWYPSMTTGNILSIIGTTPGTAIYTVVGTNTNGCTQSNIINVTTLSPIGVTLEFIQRQFCLTDAPIFINQNETVLGISNAFIVPSIVGIGSYQVKNSGYNEFNCLFSYDSGIIIKNCTTTAINLHKSQSAKLEIYPNPTSDGYFNLKNATLGATMYIYNAMGSVIYTQKIFSENMQINAKLVRGIYFVKQGNESIKLAVDY